MDSDSDAAGPSPSALEDLLAPLLDLETVAQPAALAALCAEHPALAVHLRRRYAVLARFGLHDDHGGPPLGVAEPELPPGGEFGGFRIRRLLGRGAMGVVYLAEDRELGRLVALKLIRGELLASERARERFRREVAAAAKISHPGICAVYGTGEVGGQPFLALQHIDGESLEEQLRRARAEGLDGWGTVAAAQAHDLRPAVELVESLARALHTAHDAGLVHRDVKPGNVLLGRDGHAVLTDFGLARDTDSSTATLTLSSDLVGTPAYMAPEQVRGGEVDRRTDVHALGSLLYECLTLLPPYPGRDREDLYRRILTEPVIPLQKLRPRASRDLATVVHKALEKEPSRRYATAGAFADDLRAVLEGRPTRVRPPGPLARAWSWVRRHRAVAAVVASLAVGLGASLVFLESSIAAERRVRAVAMTARTAALRDDPELAFRVLRAALDLAAEPEVVAAVHDVLPQLGEWQLVRTVRGRVESVERSPSGRWLLVAGQDIDAAIHRADGTHWHDLPQPIMPARPVFAFSPDENALAVWLGAGPRGQHATGLAVFDLAGPRPVERWRMPVAEGDAVVGLAWGRDDRIIGVFSPDGDSSARIATFAAATGAPIGSGFPLPDGSRAFAMLPDGRLVLGSGIWEADGSACLVPFPRTDARAGVVRRVCVDGDRVVLCADWGVRVVGVDGTLLWQQLRQQGFASQARVVDVAADGDVLLAFQDGEVWLIGRDGQTLQSWSEGSSVFSARFTADGQRILTADWRGRIRLRDRGGALLDLWRGHRLGAFLAPLGPGAETVLTGSWNGAVELWRPGGTRGLPLRSGFARASLLVCGDRLVVASDDGRLLALDQQGGIVARRVLPPGAFVLSRHRDEAAVWVVDLQRRELWAWSPGGDLLLGPFAVPVNVGPLAQLESGALLLPNYWNLPGRLWDPDAKALLPQTIPAVAWCDAARGGQVVVTVGDFGALRVHDGRGNLLRAGRERDARGADARAAYATCVRVSDDGRFAIVGYDDGSVSLWDLAVPAPVHRWLDHRPRVRNVAISRDGRRVASIATSGHLVVREAGRATPLLEWRSDTETLESVAFFGDEAVVTSGWRDSGVIRWWWWDPDVLRGKLDQVPRVELTEDQQRILTQIVGPR